MRQTPKQLTLKNGRFSKATCAVSYVRRRTEASGLRSVWEGRVEAILVAVFAAFVIAFRAVSLRLYASAIFAVVLVAQTVHMSPADVEKLPSQPPLAKIAYGKASQQYAELRMPEGRGPFPVVAILHGGCYGDYASATYTAPIATALLREGWATWNVEYRREQEAGGGWPGTFLDAGNGIDALRQAAQKYQLDLSRVVVMGHSAGGQLALWVAARKRVPANSEVSMVNPLPVRGAVSLAGIVDMRAFAEYGRGPCGERHIRVMGGTPEQRPARYALVDPAELLPLGIVQHLIWGAEDTVVPERLFKDYEKRAQASGDRVEVTVLERTGHHDMCSPKAPSWIQIVAAIRAIMH
jgi:acetyl esterase/lipase